MAETYAMPFDEGDVEAAAPPTKEELGNIADLLEKLRCAKALVDIRTAELKAANEELRLIEEDSLPNALTTARTKKFTAEDGTTVELKDSIHASIKEENKPAAYAWLRENGHGDLIKRAVTVSFGRGQEESATALIELIEQSNSITHSGLEDSSTVHAGTLKAFCKEQITTGQPLDEQLLGVFRRRYAEVKPPKAAKKF